MPIQPDPTHPKFLEGDEVLQQQDDDVSGHIQSSAVEEPGSTPEQQKTRSTDDVEGHFRSAQLEGSSVEPESIKARVTDEGDEDVEGHLRGAI